MRALALALLLAALAGPSAAQGDQPDQKSQEEMMKVYEAAAAPGPQHAMIAKGVGLWDCTVKSWMDPQGEPEISKGTEESELLFGGRYLTSRFKGTMMGRPYEGMGTLGFDNVKKKYVGTWFDSMGTGILTFEGDYNAQTKEIVSHGSYADAMSGQEQRCRLVSRFVSDDQHIFEMWGPDPSGREAKWMEITYNRVK